MKPIEFAETLARVDMKATAAHARMDKFETQTVESLKSISGDVKLLLAYMHGTRGRDKGIMLMCTLFGGAVGTLVGLVWKKFF